MPDRALSRPARRSAGAAFLVSVALHAGLIAPALWLAPAVRRAEPPALPVSELVVYVEDRGGGKDVPEVSVGPEPIDPGMDVPAPPPVVQARLVEPPVVPQAVDPGTEPTPQVRGTFPAAPAAPRPTAGGSGTGNGPGDETGSGFFRAPPTGRTIVYVLDRSMSMGLHDGLKQARRELLASLARLPAGATFQVIPYNHVAEPISVRGYGGLLRADAETLAEVARVVEALRPTGRTDHVGALRRGLAFQPDVLFFATDADELTATDVAAVTRLNAGRCAVHVVDFSNRPDEAAGPLRQLAEQNRGTYRRLPVKEW